MYLCFDLRPKGDLRAEAALLRLYGIYVSKMWRKYYENVKKRIMSRIFPSTTGGLLDLV